METELCISRLEGMKKTAKKAEERLIDTVLENIDTIGSYTINSLADEAGVSYATVCRMLEKIGISGFKEFKKVLSGEIPKKEEKKKTKPEAERENSLICDGVFKSTEQLISFCRENLKGETLDKSVELLSSAGSVMLIGVGGSSISARYAYMCFLGLGKQCFFSTDMIMAKMKASLLNKGDVLVAISSSGKTKQVIEAAKVARKEGAAVISLCDDSDAPLVHVSDVSICTGEGKQRLSKEADVPLIQGQITAVNVLYSCVSEKNTKEKAVSDYE